MLDALDHVTTVSIRRSPTTPRLIREPARVGHYELGRCLGRGGMGSVFEGRHLLLDRRAAVKVIRNDLRDSREARTRLAHEARALARLQHPNVVTLYEIGHSEQDVFIAMELLDGGTLREWMRTPHPWRETIELFVAFGSGLAAAHELGFVHRDVNPSNVFLARDGTPKLGDFGLVRADRERDVAPAQLEMWPFEPTLTVAGSVLGTPAYMAPEQARGDRVDARADQFAFCIALHEALVGELPRHGNVGALPRWLHEILTRGLAANPEARFSSVRALLAALRGYGR